MDYLIRKRLTTKGEERFVVSLEVWVNGERKPVSGGTHASQREAVRAGEKLLMQYEDNGEKLKVLRGNVTLADWTEEWIASLATKGSTKNSYGCRMRSYVLPTLGEVQLKNLTYHVADRWLNGPVLSHLDRSTRKGALGTLRICLNKAVKIGMLSENPVQGLKLETTQSQDKAEKKLKKVKSWTYDEVQLLLDAAEGLPVEPLAILGLLAGLRPGEAMVVRWADIDWSAGVVDVSKTYTRTEGYRPAISDSTKGGADRLARLTSDAAFRLMRIKAQREALGPLDSESAIYEYSQSSNSTPYKQVKSLCKVAGVKTLSPHCFRHTHASLLLENGATLAAVAKQLGHSNPIITAQVYWHLIDDQMDTISGVMDKALGRLQPVEPKLVEEERHQ